MAAPPPAGFPSRPSVDAGFELGGRRRADGGSSIEHGVVDNAAATTDRFTSVELRGKYRLHPFWLTFTDPSLEEEFKQHYYIDSGYFSGRAYVALLGVLTLVVSVIHPTGGYPDAAQFSSWVWLPNLVVGIQALLLSPLMFVAKLARFREHLVIWNMLFHWPTYMITNMLGKDPIYFNYAYCTGCSFFCAFLARPRFLVTLFALSMGPIVAQFSLAFGTSYFRGRTQLEMVFWPFLGFGLTMLHIVERHTRMSFVAQYRNKQLLSLLETQMALTSTMIARYFPPTPTLRLIKSGGAEIQTRFSATSLIVTDIVGFTSWSSTAASSDVVDLVTDMFCEFDAMAPQHGVEKVSTVGDCYFGAIFGECTTMSAANDTVVPTPSQGVPQRAAAMVRFAFACRRFVSRSLQLRVGTHIGDVTGIFVGRQPPKFDLFGSAVNLCKELEHVGEPNAVHISFEMEQLLASSSISPTGIVRQTPIGTCFSTFEERLLPVLHPICGDHPQPLEHPREMEDDDGGGGHAAMMIDDDAEQLSSLYLRQQQQLGHLRNHSGDVASSLLRLVAAHDVRGEEVIAAARAGREAPPAAAGASVNAHMEEEDSSAEMATVEQQFDLSYLRLEFKNTAVEKRYRQWCATGSASVPNVVCVLIATVWAVICGLLLLCADNQNRLILAVVVALLVALALYLHTTSRRSWTGNHQSGRATNGRGGIGDALRLNVAVAAVYFPITLMCWLGLRAGCDATTSPMTPYSRAAYTGDIAFAFHFLWFIANHVILETPFKWRILLSFLSFGPYYHILFAIRKTYSPNDGVAEWTWTPGLIFAAFCLCSYSMDLSERLTFVSHETVKRVLRSAKGRSAAGAQPALSSMGPAFVAQRLLQHAASSHHRQREAAAAANSRRRRDEAEGSGASPPGNGHIPLLALEEGGGDPSTPQQDSPRRTAETRDDHDTVVSSVSDDDDVVLGDGSSFANLRWQLDAVAIVFIQYGGAEEEDGETQERAASTALVGDVGVACPKSRSQQSDARGLGFSHRRLPDNSWTAGDLPGSVLVRDFFPAGSSRLPPAYVYRPEEGTIDHRAIVCDIEVALSSYNVIKIKSSGTSVLAVAGVDADATQHATSANVVAALQAAAACARGPLRGVEKWTIGIHIGPCFGAVIGGTGLMFDLFGDTVNVASRFSTTALPGTIQVSQLSQRYLDLVPVDVLREQLPPWLQRDASNRALDVKGKGALEASVYRVDQPSA